MHKDTETTLLEKSLFIHILADFGETAPETTIYKAILYTRFPNSTIIFTNQPFKLGDTIAPGTFLRLIYKDFPPNCIHLCLLHIDSRLPEKYILAKAKGQYFFAPDNGIVSLAFPGEDVDYFKLQSELPVVDVFKTLYLPALQKWVEDETNTGEIETKARRSILVQPTITGNIYRLSVQYNDVHGNAYLNMQQQEFEKIVNGKKFRFKIGMRETIERISNAYTDVPEGTKLALFGFGDMLQIAINCGSAAQYLGLNTGQMVMMEVE